MLQFFIGSIVYEYNEHEQVETRELFLSVCASSFVSSKTSANFKQCKRKPIDGQMLNF